MISNISLVTLRVVRRLFGKLLIRLGSEKRLLWLTRRAGRVIHHFLWMTWGSCRRKAHQTPPRAGRIRKQARKAGLFANQFDFQGADGAPRDQSRSSSLIEVLERVRASTVFMITAQ